MGLTWNIFAAVHFEQGEPKELKAVEIPVAEKREKRRERARTRDIKPASRFSSLMVRCLHATGCR